MTKKKYIETGQCIWCLKKEPEVSFFNKPHTISKKLGATKIGFDICDSCNNFFGTIDRNQKYRMSVELAFKEILNIMRLLLKNDLNENTYKSFKSVYFSYHHSESTIRIKSSFKLQPYFIGSLTRQFKKGIYETFLQEYHRVTKNGLDDRFNPIRKFVRYDIGNPPLYFLENNGVHFVEEDIDNISFHFPENVLSQIDDFGFYTMLIYSNVFFLEVTPRADLTREIFLNKESRKLIGSGFIYTQLRKLEYITDIDFTLRKLYGNK
ncbi:MAG: hypothetical protein K0M40_12690 [Prolixibacteraceae bacterium]|nr:hypothetical protein [Prolixibacteraceae bacterium]